MIAEGSKAYVWEGLIKKPKTNLMRRRITICVPAVFFPVMICPREPPVYQASYCTLVPEIQRAHKLFRDRTENKKCLLDLIRCHLLQIWNQSDLHQVTYEAVASWLQVLFACGVSMSFYAIVTKYNGPLAAIQACIDVTTNIKLWTTTTKLAWYQVSLYFVRF